MTRFALVSLLIAVSSASLSAQTAIPRASAEVDAIGVFPVSGYLTDAYAFGPGLRAGAELRLTRHLAADAGWNSGWMPVESCNRFGCSYTSRLRTELLDYGVGGVLPIFQGRAELSLGVGGGYIWFDRFSSNTYYNGSLLQYSGKIAVPLGSGGHWRFNATVRAWRDLGRPIQQWLTTAAGVSYGVGSVR